MQLPGYRPNGPQGLGREPTGARRALGNAQSSAARAEAESGLAIARSSLGNTRANLAMGDYNLQQQGIKARSLLGAAHSLKDIADALTQANDTSELMDRVTKYERDIMEFGAAASSKNFYKSNELPQDIASKFTHAEIDPITGGTLDVQDKIIPADKVIPLLYPGTLDSLERQYTAGLDTKGREAFLNVTRSTRNSVSSNLINKTYEFKAARIKTDTNMSFQRCMNAGNEECANNIANIALGSNIWDPMTFERNVRFIGEEIDYRQLTRMMEQGGEDGISTARALLLEGKTRVGPDKFDRILSRADRKLDRIDREREKWVKESRDLAEITDMDRVNSGDMSFEDVQRNAQSYTSGGRKNLEAAAIRFQRGNTPIIDQEKLSWLRDSAINIPFPRGTGSTAQASVNIMGQAIKAYSGGEINLEQYKEVKNLIVEGREFNYRTSDYKSAEKQIVFELTGSSMSGFLGQMEAMETSLGEKGISPQATAASQAIEDLRMEVRLKGIEADPMGWWQANRERYTIQAVSKKGAERYQTRYGNAVLDDNGEINTDATQIQILNKYREGRYDKSEMNRRLKQLWGGQYGTKWGD